MEVHAHTHTARKKWTHYFWEFLMLFLAVFCGFMAEYQLEHKIEKDREKKFMQLLAQDLQADVDSVARIKIHRLERYNQSDSLRTILVSGAYKNNGSDMYYWGRNVSRRRFFYSADGTLQQLKNSGSLRLIRNKKIIQKLIAYDVTYRNYLRQLEVEMALVEQYRNTAARIFDGVVFQNLSAQNVVYRPEGNPQLFDSSPASVNELINKLNYLMGGQYRLTELLDGLTTQATELLSLIKKDYSIK
jgi:hypothetical protein